MELPGAALEFKYHHRIVKCQMLDPPNFQPLVVFNGVPDLRDKACPFGSGSHDTKIAHSVVKRQTPRGANSVAILAQALSSVWPFLIRLCPAG